MATNEETNAAGTDTRPPMLVESDYESWKIRIHRYIRGKPNGKLIWKSIQNGPTPHPMITDPPLLILLLMLMQGSVGLVNKEVKICLNESCENDKKITTSLNIPTHQMNTKFVNNLPAIGIANPLKWFPKAVTTNQQPAQTSTNCQGRCSRQEGEMYTDCRGEGMLLEQCKEQKERWPLSTTQRKALLDGSKRERNVFYARELFNPLSATNIKSNEVHSNDNPNSDNWIDQLNQEIHQDEHLDSDAETELMTITIRSSYHFDNRSPNYQLRNCLVKQAYWLPANERASQTSNPK
ncbi:hypothetical protein Tco_0938392 [Tanacetum coccineum]|uniref:Uncharacterized protein n=1 Tax=Tanacetum coccineum TaxID=301880 RepID=A0ABQ5DHX2_9ASTR